jgi:choline kinase
MPSVKHVVIAAAGLGSRLGMGKPKCMVEVQGRPILAYLLDLLDDIEDVRFVIGFGEEQVMETVRKIRSDVIFVRNPNFHSTKTIDSYALGARGIKDSVLYMDADIIFEPASFSRFLSECSSGEYLIGVTDAKTEDAVFVEVDDRKTVRSFSREKQSPLEWANIVYTPPAYFEGKSGDVFQQLAKDLPLKSCYINSFEVDRLSDLEKANAFARNL